MIVFEQQPRRTWTLAVAGALAFHALVVLALRALDPLAGASAEPTAPRPIEVVFAPEERPPEPDFFSELPEDRADERPEQPDFLSNVDSRARDRQAGGDDAMPLLEGTSEAPHVEMIEGVPEPPAPVAEREPTPEPARREAAEPEDVAEAEPPERSRSPSLLAALMREQLAAEPDREPRKSGTSDFPQEAMSNPTANAGLLGDISLNTMAWEYAPWLQEFRRAVFERWNPPIAYLVGLIDGWVIVQLEIAPDGRLLRMHVPESDVGHESLEGNVRYALEAAAPYRPLPDHFPEETLMLQIRFVYPKLRR